MCGGNAEEKLKRFLQYDYVGAPWPNWIKLDPCNGVGNGGFSLRNVKVMRDISAQFGQTSENEDVYFCNHLPGWKSMKLADSAIAGEFSAEKYDGLSQDSYR